MLIPVNWLKKYIETQKTDREIADILTLSGTEVEKISSKKISFSGVEVGEILSVAKHPNADRLNLVTVLTSGGQQTVVCGAKNVEEGQKIAFANEGAKLGKFELKKVNIRGVESAGMIASAAELGLSNDHENILVLNSTLEIGTPLEKALNLSGIVLEAEITPNRADEYSVVGVARELAAITGEKLEFPNVDVDELDKNAFSEICVEVLNDKLCSQYLVRVIEVKEIKDSPSWLKNCLEEAGVRPINLIVDITNYVMLELGQPLHAFDQEKISGGKIIVRNAQGGELITTLDGEKRKLSSEMLVIADEKSSIAIAGVMGGKDSEVTKETKKIILESATFNKISVRKTSDKLGLRTEAVNRFEKGIPFNLAALAINRAAYLIQRYGEGKVYKDIIGYSRQDEEKIVTLPIHLISKKLGLNISVLEVTDYLKSLGFEIFVAENKIEAKVPWWRLDISIAEDLLEEIARLYDYNNFVSTLPIGAIHPQKNTLMSIDFKLKDEFVGMGFNEILSYSFISGDDIEAIGINLNDCVKIDNPLSSEQEYMRPSLLPSMLRVVEKNQRNFNQIRIFEIAKTYIWDNGTPKEEIKISLCISDVSDSCDIYPQGGSFYLLKGVLEQVFAFLNLEVVIKPAQRNNFHLGRTAELIIGDKILGFLAEVLSNKAIHFGIKRRVVYAELDFATLVSFYGKVKKYSSIPKFPIVSRDLSFVINNEVLFSDLYLLARSVSPMISSVELIDVYTKGIELGKLSKAIRVFITPRDKTLTDENINDIMNKLAKLLHSKFGAVIRTG